MIFRDPKTNQFYRNKNKRWETYTPGGEWASLHPGLEKQVNEKFSRKILKIAKLEDIFGGNGEIRKMVGLVATGYEWRCIECSKRNVVPEICEEVECKSCKKVYDVHRINHN